MLNANDLLQSEKGRASTHRIDPFAEYAAAGGVVASFILQWLLGQLMLLQHPVLLWLFSILQAASLSIASYCNTQGIL